MVRIKILEELEGNENYQLARERYIQLDDEAILALAKAIESTQQSVHPTGCTCTHINHAAGVVTYKDRACPIHSASG
jgi:formate dehydrogenase assembly factor FdhD